MFKVIIKTRYLFDWNGIWFVTELPSRRALISNRKRKGSLATQISKQKKKSGEKTWFHFLDYSNDTWISCVPQYKYAYMSWEKSKGWFFIARNSPQQEVNLELFGRKMKLCMHYKGKYRFDKMNTLHCWWLSHEIQRIRREWVTIPSRSDLFTVRFSVKNKCYHKLMNENRQVAQYLQS